MATTLHDRVRALITWIDGDVRAFVTRDEPRGLLNGQCGAALFHAYAYRWTQDDAQLESLQRVIERSLAALEIERPSPSHCGGLAGIAWCLQHLIHEGFIEADEPGDVFTQVDPLLAAAMTDGLARGQHDFLHEGLGIALYFLDKLPDPAARAHLERAVASLEATAVRERDALRWQDRFTREGTSEPSYNLGLAHGTPGIMVVLARCHELGVLPARVAPLLRGAASWLRATRNPPGTGARYPIRVDAADRALGPVTSRLGWCYGDLGVAIALQRTGSALGDRDCLDEAGAIFAHTASQRTVANGAIDDASLCHGSMGVSHIFRRAYQATGNADLEAAAERWLAHTLALGASEVGFQAKLANRYVDSYDLLQGLTGIGLGLLAAVDRETAPDWDRCLLLS
jgi:lantibiotic modifying enzyme